MLDASVFPSRNLPFAICIAEANAFPWLTDSTECVRSCGGSVKDKKISSPFTSGFAGVPLPDLFLL